MFVIRYKGLRIVPTLSSARELVKECKTLHDVLGILENGYDAPRKRKTGTIEKWIDKGKKTYNAVVVGDYDDLTKEKVWVLIHFGKFTRRLR